MNRLTWSVLSAAAILVAAPPAPAVGADPSNRHAHAQRGGDALGWVLVSDGTTSMSEMKDLESLEDLKARYGATFLLLREGERGYLIRDDALIDRAERATRSIKLYGKEIGLLGRFQAGEAISGKSSRKIAALAQRGPRDESNARLEREVEELTRDLEALGDDARHTDSARSRELERRSEAVLKQLHEALRRGQEELRRILKDAQARNLAKRVDWQ